MWTPPSTLPLTRSIPSYPRVFPGSTSTGAWCLNIADSTRVVLGYLPRILTEAFQTLLLVYLGEVSSFRCDLNFTGFNHALLFSRALLTVFHFHHCTPFRPPSPEGQATHLAVKQSTLGVGSFGGFIIRASRSLPSSHPFPLTPSHA